MIHEIAGVGRTSMAFEIPGAAKRKRLTLRSRLARKEESGSAAMRKGMARPSPTRRW